MRVTTWNVLHRIHAVNWKEPPVLAFPDEHKRTTLIAGTVARWLAGDVQVVCLQEVSGDQLARLREALSPDVALFDHLYPRVPRLRDGGAPVLDDPTEHLVLIVKGLPARLRASRTFESDPGKGLLAVEIDAHALVVDTHVSWGPRATAQLDLVAETAGEDQRAAAVLGDFNAPADVVSSALGEAFTLANVVGPTRIATAELGGKTIDHVAVRKARIASAAVLDAEGLSDHHPVTAKIVF